MKRTSNFRCIIQRGYFILNNSCEISAVAGLYAQERGCNAIWKSRMHLFQQIDRVNCASQENRTRISNYSVRKFHRHGPGELSAVDAGVLSFPSRIVPILSPCSLQRSCISDFWTYYSRPAKLSVRPPKLRLTFKLFRISFFFLTPLRLVCCSSLLSLISFISLVSTHLFPLWNSSFISSPFVAFFFSFSSFFGRFLGCSFF